MYFENLTESYCHPVFISRASHMDTLIRRCPFLAAGPGVRLKLAAQLSLRSYAHMCPVLMELATGLQTRALSSSGSLSTPRNDGQLQNCDYERTEGFDVTGCYIVQLIFIILHTWNDLDIYSFGSDRSEA